MTYCLFVSFSFFYCLGLSIADPIFCLQKRGLANKDQNKLRHVNSVCCQLANSLHSVIEIIAVIFFYDRLLSVLKSKAEVGK